MYFYGSMGIKDTRTFIEEQLIGKQLQKLIERHVFLCSLRCVPESQVAAILSSYKVTKTVDEIRAVCDNNYYYQQKEKILHDSNFNALP